MAKARKNDNLPQVELSADPDALEWVDVLRRVHMANAQLEPEREELRKRQAELKAKEDELNEIAEQAVAVLRPKLGVDGGIGLISGIPIMRGAEQGGSRRFQTDAFFNDHPQLQPMRDSYTKVTPGKYQIRLLPEAFPGGDPP
ncbi:hypothetical protein [Microbispora sp. NBRC 16548]|uniref:hypothetical protein n=1 Tax=Microbispora sp. NBRC 16548 TaxID=3030994 RepID=UPI0024A399E9|nr:hypothetical protein [Microbispora sp. NBRC 16548]GLX06695.1 hypothetical protein Misp03_36220 [Microbispora sp. NBRC 16548]